MMTSSNFSNEPYIVLARKYRPKDFSDLRGQDVLIQTISNAIKMGRIPHAFLLTGIRGIGKTTTARIITKTLSCTDKQEINKQILPCGKCENCLAFARDKHPDFIEIDAASKTGVSDIREVIENCRYLPQLSKYKIYVIDEVHMLSINAFNALLKTLEEPPKHVIFVFATTEVRKVPITILSRCQRFDLKRLTHEAIVEHLEDILSKEKLEAEKAALDIIAKCSEGSVRDSLSLLDQSLMYTTKGKILANSVSSIIGIGDKSEVIDLFCSIVNGKVDKALEILNSLYLKGVDQALLLNDLLEIINLITKRKYINILDDSSYILSDEDIKKLLKFSDILSIPYLTMLWQLIIKGLSELQYSSNIMGSLQMLIIRCCYIWDKPMPIEIINSLNEDVQTHPTSKEISTQKQEITLPVEHIQKNTKPNDIVENITQDHVNLESKVIINNFIELTKLFSENKEMIIYHHLYEDVHLVKFEQRVLKIRAKNNVPHNFANQISILLDKWTGVKWVVSLSAEEGEKTLREVDNLAQNKENDEIVDDDIVREVMKQFDGSKITNISKK